MENLELLKIRARALNNDRQIERMKRDKLRTLHRALLYSYQSAWIKRDDQEEYHRALINPDKIKFDYDEKIVSIDPTYGYKPGDVFEWRNTNTRWLILNQELTELAYFRGNCRRCQTIEVTDKESGQSEIIWAAIRGPVETKINSIQKSGIVADVPNLSLNIYMPLTENNLKHFDRYQRFYFSNRYWMVQAIDDISTPGILEINAEEDYKCDHEDLIVKVVDPNPPIDDYQNDIIGETFVYPLSSNIYKVKQEIFGAEWQVSLPSQNKDIDDVLTWEITPNGELKVTWDAMVSGSYVITYGDLTKTIIVQSLF